MLKNCSLKIIQILKYTLLGVFIWGVITILPLFQLLRHPSMLWEKHLILLMNEAEARPCGGFVTAFGAIRFIPFEAELKNIYHFLEVDFGESPLKLQKVSPRLKFWDLGFESDPGLCTKRFEYAYKKATGETVDRVWLVNFGFIESLIGRIGSFTFEDQNYDKANFFSALSRKVSDLDRHSEKALEMRKSPLAQIGKALIQKALFNPLVWPSLAQEIKESLNNGDIFSPGIARESFPNKDKWQLVEWNLGGGKSSRVLEKDFDLSLRENLPGKWSGHLQLTIEHLGGEDEPLSQDYKGTFVITPPSWVSLPEQTVDLALKPGERWQKDFEIESIQNPEKNLQFFIPRGQSWNGKINLSLFPGQILRSEAFKARESVGTWSGKLQYAMLPLYFESLEDTNAPFVTLHEAMPLKAQAQNFDAEVHFNEKVSGEKFQITVTAENRSLATIKNFRLLQDQKTLLFGVYLPREIISGERFTMSLERFEDFWGNSIDPTKTWTLIPR